MTEDLCQRFIDGTPCLETLGAHKVNSGCPRDITRRFKRFAGSVDRASGSFADDELEVMHQVLQTVLRGGDVRVLVRAEAFPRVVRKVTAMRQRIVEQRAAVGAKK